MNECNQSHIVFKVQFLIFPKASARDLASNTGNESSNGFQGQFPFFPKVFNKDQGMKMDNIPWVSWFISPVSLSFSIEAAYWQQPLYWTCDVVHFLKRLIGRHETIWTISPLWIPRFFFTVCKMATVWAAGGGRDNMNPHNSSKTTAGTSHIGTEAIPRHPKPPPDTIKAFPTHPEHWNWKRNLRKQYISNNMWTNTLDENW